MPPLDSPDERPTSAGPVSGPEPYTADVGARLRSLAPAGPDAAARARIWRRVADQSGLAAQAEVSRRLRTLTPPEPDADTRARIWRRAAHALPVRAPPRRSGSRPSPTFVR